MQIKRLFFWSMIILVSSRVTGQDMNFDLRKSAVQRAYEIFGQYADNSDFKDEGGRFSQRKADAFIKLFTQDALVYDGINKTDSINYKLYKTGQKKVGTYIQDLKTNFPSGINFDIIKATAYFDDLPSKHMVLFACSAILNGTDVNGRTFNNIDSVMITVSYDSSYKVAGISKIERTGGQLICSSCKKETKTIGKKPEPAVVADNARAIGGCVNDDDCDGVINALDECPDIPGDLPNGCPSGYKMGVAIQFDIMGGGNADFYSAPSLSKLSPAYSNLSNASINNTSTGIGGSFAADLLVDLQFGIKRNYGITFGLMYTYRSSTYSVGSFTADYEAYDQENSPFKRILTTNNFKENISQNNISIPLLFKVLSSNLSKSKLGYFFELGPVITIYANSTSKISSSNNFEGIYDYSSGNVSSYASTPTSNQLVLTRAALTAHGSTNVGSDFNTLYNSGYNVGLDYAVNGSKAPSVNLGAGIGGMIRGGLTYKLSSSLKFIAGLQINYIYTLHSAEAYAPVVAANAFKNSGGVTYESFINGMGAVSALNFGINLGFIYSFTSKKKVSKAN